MANLFLDLNLDSNSISSITIKDFLDKFDKIIAEYVLSININDIHNLLNEKYCSRLTRLFKHILKTNFSDQEMYLINTRIDSGNTPEVINEIANTNNFGSNTSESEKKTYIAKTSRFIVKMFHIYAVILKTLNPTFIYNSNGAEKKVDLNEKHLIQDKLTVDRFNICNKRLNFMVSEINDCYKDIDNCSLVNKLSLIPEFMPLYYDVFDLDTMRYNSMSYKATKQYNDDLKTFYLTLTGLGEMPADITRFSDIQFPECINLESETQTSPDPTVNINNIANYLTTNAGNRLITNSLFENFARHLANITNNSSKQQNDIIVILERMFLVSNNYSIHPKMTETKLKSNATQCRKNIIKTFLSCEKDYKNSLNILESIVELIRFNTNKRRIKLLEEAVENLVE